MVTHKQIDDQEQKAAEQQPSMDDVLRRMLSTPPQPHVKKKPADKPAEKKKPA
jgi:hypothetical protein